MEESRKKLVVVLGMHRSGTSVAARALKVLGVDLGDHLIPPIKNNNDRGFWEDIDINNFNNELLDKMGSNWDRLTILDETNQHHKFAEEKAAAKNLLTSK